MQDFKTRYGPWALVAGASEGIGAAFAAGLAKRGLNLVLLARRLDKLEELSGILGEKYPVEIKCHSLDLADAERTREFVSGLEMEIGLLVYNTAHAPIGYFENIPAADLKKIVDVNITAPLLLTRLVVDKMIPRGRGALS
jgi:hypothetical protein